MSFSKSIYNAMNTIPEVISAGSLHFDVAPSGANVPYLTFVPGADPGASTFLCSANQGQKNIQINIYSGDRFTAHETISEIRDIIKVMGGEADGYYYYRLSCSDIVSYGTVDSQVYRYTFEVSFHWETILT